MNLSGAEKWRKGKDRAGRIERLDGGWMHPASGRARHRYPRALGGRMACAEILQGAAIEATDGVDWATWRLLEFRVGATIEKLGTLLGGRQEGQGVHV